MKISRLCSVPLILQDPYISIWSSGDKLYDVNTSHWCGTEKPLYGYISVNGKYYRFLGKNDMIPAITQTELDVSATTTTAKFENEFVSLKVKFVSPLLPKNPLLISRPCTYIDFEITKKNKNDDVHIFFLIDEKFVYDTQGAVIGYQYTTDNFNYAYFGKAQQTPLGHSGDKITIDWGYCYLASDDKNVSVKYTDNKLIADISATAKKYQTTLILAYDDTISINYFGDFKKAYWTSKYKNILEAISASFIDKNELFSLCKNFDKKLEEDATKTINKEYALLCALSFRQVVAAHKLITDNEDNLIFLSKENHSNGCIGTVDVTYPSFPMFMLYNPELIKAMLIPIFKFAKCDVWDYDYAPHDLGRYPYATGQVYGRDKTRMEKEFLQSAPFIAPYYCNFPSGSKVYDNRFQMPVEECGNMILLTEMVCKAEKSSAFAKKYNDLLKKWVVYLIKFGEDPGEQLCTDDFAGHLAENANLSAKAILAVAAYSEIQKQMGNEKEYNEYFQAAKKMAENWQKKAAEGDHTVLSYLNRDTWSLKYNLIFDKLLKTNLFKDELFKSEINYYTSKANEYGTPLDSRSTYTKSDWITWCAAFTDDKKLQGKMIHGIYKFVTDCKSRIPFSDWYFTDNGEYKSFVARSVQGGLFMPILIKEIEQSKE